MSKSKKVWGSDFVKLAKSKGYIVKKPTQEEFEKFINFVLVGKSVSGGPKTVKVALKARKKTNRSSNNYEDKWAWVELRTVNGDFGWLYGDADFVIFELKTEYVFVNRKRLLQYIHSNIDFDLPFVQNSWEAKYKIYQRKNKLDQITQVKIANLLDFENVYTWKKE